MIIYIDNEGRENIIRSNELIIKLIKSKEITEKTLLKTEIAGDWISAKDYDLYQEISGNTPSIVEDKTKKEKKAKELMEDYLKAINDSTMVMGFKNKWNVIGLLRDLKAKEFSLIEDTKDFEKSQFWLVSINNNFELFLGRRLYINIGALTADSNRWAKELFEGIYEITEGEQFINKETALAKKNNGFFQIHTLGKIQIPTKSIQTTDNSQIDEKKTVEENTNKQSNKEKNKISKSSIPEIKMKEKKIEISEKKETEVATLSSKTVWTNEDVLVSNKNNTREEKNQSDSNHKNTPNGQSFHTITKINKINILKIFLYSCIGLSAATLIADYLTYNLMKNFLADNFIYTYEIEKKTLFYDNLVMYLSRIYIVVMFITYFFGARWIYRSNLNLQNISTIKLRFSPGWAVGWYFIPIMSLWKPYQAMKEIYLKSVQIANLSQKKELPGFFIMWWLTWIVTNYLGWAFLRYSLSAEELNELIAVSQLAIVFDLIDIINVYLFLKIVQTISSIHNHIFNN